jgi:hypothetical protein
MASAEPRRFGASAGPQPRKIKPGTTQSPNPTLDEAAQHAHAISPLPTHARKIGRSSRTSAPYP